MQTVILELDGVSFNAGVGKTLGLGCRLLLPTPLQIPHLDI